MEINLIPDASVSSAPPGFTSAVQAAADIYDQDFPGNYTVNISYGWGTYDNQIDPELTNAQISLGGSNSLSYVSYATVKSWLAADATTSTAITAVASLPASTTAFPGDANSILVSSAQEKALGVFSGNSNAIDGSMGFGTQTFDWEGLALTEIGHALGWLTDYYAGGPTIADLFRYSAPGVYQWTGGQPAYFSIDGGITNLANFSTTFDDTLFTNIAANDPFNVGGVGTSTETLTSFDIEMFNAIGFDPPPPAPMVSSLAASTSTHTALVNTGDMVTITMTVTAPVTVTGIPTLQLSDNEVATYSGGSGTDAITFSYTVQSADVSTNLRVTGLNLPNGAAIGDAGGPLTGNATSDLTIAVNSPYLLAASSDIGATVTNAGHLITIAFDLSDTVTVTGTPTLQLNDNEVAYYTGGSGTNALSFVYVPIPTDNVVDLQVIGLNLPTGASITDANGNNLSGTVAGDLGLTITGPVTPATVAQEVNGLYVTLYGLAATAAGIAYWENVLSNFDPSITTANAATTPISVADQTYLGQQMTAGSPQVNGTSYFATLYPASMSDMAFVQALYQNMSDFIGTTAGDNYWYGLLQQLEAGNGGDVIAARESIAGQFMHDFMSNDLTLGAAYWDLSQSDYTLLVNGQQALLNKVVVSQYYADETQASGGSIINYTSVTDAAFTASHNVAASITDEPSTVAVAITGINNAIAHQNLSLV